MYLYCMRHGEAELDVIDSERALSAQGQSDVRRMGKYLAKQGYPISQIVQSGMLRAEQTAEAVAHSLKEMPRLEAMPELQGESLVEPMAEQIQHWQEDTMLVSHMPFISNLVSYLVTGQAHLGLTAFPPAGLVVLERSRPGVWQIVMVLSPMFLVVE